MLCTSLEKYVPAHVGVQDLREETPDLREEARIQHEVQERVSHLAELNQS